MAPVRLLCGQPEAQIKMAPVQACHFSGRIAVNDKLQGSRFEEGAALFRAGTWRYERPAQAPRQCRPAALAAE
jgi:hypothetical protein